MERSKPAPAGANVRKAADVRREGKKMRTVDFKDLAGLAGQEVGVSDWLEVAQDRVNKFAEATGDFQWIHVDVERATREMGGPIAHGYLIVSLIPHLNDSMLKVEGVERALNYGSDRVRFTNMVKVGKRVRLRNKFLSVEPKSGGLQVKAECTVEIEGEAKPACVAETITLFFQA
jgi:acyl dehydratase